MRKPFSFAFWGLVMVLVGVNAVWGHQPRIVYRSQLTQANPMKINKPEVSQAFYGELRGQAEYYTMSSPQGFDLYVQVLSPQIAGADKDFIVEVIRADQLVAELKGGDYGWKGFYEPFGGDDYWQGPEFEQKGAQGDYSIKVYSPDNMGKYVLVVGRVESFPFGEAVKAIVAMPRLKIYFGKSVWVSFINYIGLFLLVLLVFLAGAFWGIRLLVKRLRSKRKITV